MHRIVEPEDGSYAENQILPSDSTRYSMSISILSGSWNDILHLIRAESTDAYKSFKYKVCRKSACQSNKTLSSNRTNIHNHHKYLRNHEVYRNRLRFPDQPCPGRGCPQCRGSCWHGPETRCSRRNRKYHCRTLVPMRGQQPYHLLCCKS